MSAHNVPLHRSAAYILLAVIFAAGCYPAQSQSGGAWTILQSAVQQSNTEKRVIAVRVLGLLCNDNRATELAQKELRDPKPEVRVAAATALGQMRASTAIPDLKHALSDKELKVVLAAAHALRLLNDPSRFECITPS